jgi:hypothetical protein
MHPPDRRVQTSQRGFQQVLAMHGNLYRTLQHMVKYNAIRESEYPQKELTSTAPTTLRRAEHPSTRHLWMQLPGIFFNNFKCFLWTSISIDGQVARKIGDRPRIAITTSHEHRASGRPLTGSPKTCNTTLKSQSQDKNALQHHGPVTRAIACTPCPL